MYQLLVYKRTTYQSIETIILEQLANRLYMIHVSLLSNKLIKN